MGIRCRPANPALRACATQRKFHIGLTGCDPHIANHNVLEGDWGRKGRMDGGRRYCLHRELKRAACSPGLRYRAPMTRWVRLQFHAGFVAERDRDGLPRRSIAPDMYRQIALHNHMARRNSWQSDLC